MRSERSLSQLEHPPSPKSTRSLSRTASSESPLFADVCTARQLHEATVRHLRRCLSSTELEHDHSSACARCRINASDLGQKLFFQGRLVPCYPEPSELPIILSEDADQAMNRLHGRLGTPLASIVADEHVHHVESDIVVGGLTPVAPLTTEAPRVMSRRMLPVDSPLLSPVTKVRTNDTISATPEAAHAAKIASIRKQTEMVRSLQAKSPMQSTSSSSIALNTSTESLSSLSIAPAPMSESLKTTVSNSTVESTYQSNTVTTHSHSTLNKSDSVDIDRHAVIPTTLACDPQYQAQFELELQARDHMIANLKEQYQELSELNLVLYEKLDQTLLKLESTSVQFDGLSDSARHSKEVSASHLSALENALKLKDNQLEFEKSENATLSHALSESRSQLSTIMDQVHTLQQAAAMFESLTQSRIDSEMAKAQIEFEKTQRARVDDMLKMQTLLDEQSETLVSLRQQQTETEDRARAWRDETARLFQESMEELRVEADTKCMQAVQAERDRLTNEMQTKVNQERQKSLEAVQSAIELSKSQYELQIAQFKSEHSHELEQVKSKHHNELDRIKAQFEEKLEQHDVSAQSEIEALRANLEDQQRALASQAEQHSSTVFRLSVEHKSQMENIMNKCTSDIQSLDARHSAALHTQRAHFQAHSEQVQQQARDECEQQFSLQLQQLKSQWSNQKAAMEDKAAQNEGHLRAQLKIVETEKSQLQQQLTELVAHLNTFDEVQSSSRTLIITLQSERDALRARLEQMSLQPKQIARVEPLTAPQSTQQHDKYHESTHSTVKSSSVSATSEHNKRSVSPLEVVKEDVAVFEHAVLLELSVLQEENAAHRELLRQMSDVLTQRDQESALLRAQLQRQSVSTSRQLPITSVQSSVSSMSAQSSRVASLASWLPPSTPKKEQSHVSADANNELDARAEQLSASLKASPVMRKVLQRQ